MVPRHWALWLLWFTIFMVDLSCKSCYQRVDSAHYRGFKSATSAFEQSILDIDLYLLHRRQIIMVTRSGQETRI
mgnify:CR=1 FL=1